MERPSIVNYHTITDYIDALEDYIDWLEDLNKELIDLGWDNLEGSGLDKKLKKW